MAEKVKRLPPTPTTLRGLYLVSGNVCAYPSCDTVLINRKGTMVGDICHIRAAEENGPRFDAGMTNESRRASSNLMLMCVVHHRKVDREHTTYTVAKLQKSKVDHEKRFSEIEGTLKLRFEAQYEDQTDAIAPSVAATFARYCQVLGESLEDEERQEAASDIKSYTEVFRNLPDDDRKLVTAAIRRARKFDPRGGTRVHAEEFATALEISKARVRAFGTTLERHHLGSIDEDDPGQWFLSLRDPTDYMPWSEIARFCEAAGLELDDFTLNLHFGLLD